MKKTLLALALALSASFAQATLLSNLLNGGTITAGDKLFDNWSVILQESSTGNLVDTDHIDVQALTDGGLGGPGLSFNVSGGELSITGDDIYAFIHFTFGFKVSVTDPNLQIKDTSLRLVERDLSYDQNGDVDFQDLGVFIGEDVGTGSANLGTMSVVDRQTGGVPTQLLSDSASFAPQDEIWVTKDILVWAAAATDTANLYQFEQRFSQTARVVPEPGSLALLTLALAGLGFARRRRS